MIIGYEEIMGKVVGRISQHLIGFGNIPTMNKMKLR